MSVALSPSVNAAAFGDPALAGDWAAVLPELLAGSQVAPWCSYDATRDGRLVGLGSFKAPPDEAGRVEIAYLTLVPEERTGVARAIAAELLAIAQSAGATGALAHTLPEHNASTRVLQANGFSHVGAVEDPEDGIVWRWERPLA